MESIAIEPVSFTIHNRTPDRNPGVWARGMWCGTTLSPTAAVLVGWDGLIRAAYDVADEEPSGHWQAES